MRVRLAVFWLVWLLCLNWRVEAQTLAPVWNRTTTHDVAACRDADDQPVCLLRALSKFPTHSPYRTDWRLAGADAVLAALGENTSSPDQRFAHTPYASTRFMYGELEDDGASAAAAILADRGGARPDQALAHIRERRTLFHSCRVYQVIWNAYGSEAQRAARPQAPRPSEALARAAINACEDANPEPGQMHPSTLAAAYARFGDSEGVDRTMARDPRGSSVVRIETALLLGDINAAAQVAGAPLALVEDTARSRFAALRAEVIREAADLGRTDLVRTLVDRAIEDWSNDGTHTDALRPSVEALLRVDPSAARDFISRLDSAARDTDSLGSLTAAAAAVRGWAVLGDMARARALAEVWMPRVEPPTSAGCGGSRPFCVGPAVIEMFTEMGLVEESWAIGSGGGAMIRLAEDFARGRGLLHLETHLAHMPTPRAHDDALRWCVMLANHSQEQLAWAENCARRLLDREQRLSDDADAEFRRQLAVVASVEVAALAAGQGDLDLTQEMLSAALNLSAATTNVALGPSERRNLLEVAIFQLEAAGRL